MCKISIKICSLIWIKSLPENTGEGGKIWRYWSFKLQSRILNANFILPLECLKGISNLKYLPPTTKKPLDFLPFSFMNFSKLLNRNTTIQPASNAKKLRDSPQSSHQQILFALVVEYILKIYLLLPPIPPYNLTIITSHLDYFTGFQIVSVSILTLIPIYFLHISQSNLWKAKIKSWQFSAQSAQMACHLTLNNVRSPYHGF